MQVTTPTRPALFALPTSPAIDIGTRRLSRAVTERRPGRPPRSNTVRIPAPVPAAARDLLADAGRGLGRAIREQAAADRYAVAHLAALRAGAALLAARARPVRGRRGSVWELMTSVAPEFAEWATFFAAGSGKRRAAEAGLPRAVTPREADDMVRQAAAFVDLMHGALSAGPRPAS
jgi:hypothetical protein